jgi:hypothetical protein
LFKLEAKQFTLELLRFKGVHIWFRLEAARGELEPT